MAGARNIVMSQIIRYQISRSPAPQEVKVSSPDYTNIQDTENVVSDFLLRIEHYKEKYEPLDEDREAEFSYMKIYDTGEKVRS